MPEHLLIGLRKIHGMLTSEDGIEAMSFETFQRRHVGRMRDLGIIFEFNIGRIKRKTLCAWPSRVMWYFMYGEKKQDEKIIGT